MRLELCLWCVLLPSDLWDNSDASEIIVSWYECCFYLCSTCEGNNTESLTNVMQHVLPVWQCVFIYTCILFIYVCVCVHACFCIFSVTNLYWSFACVRVGSTVCFAYSKAGDTHSSRHVRRHTHIVMSRYRMWAFGARQSGEITFQSYRFQCSRRHKQYVFLQKIN